jgi:hypothetical protein
MRLFMDGTLMAEKRWLPMIDYIAQELNGKPIEFAEIGVFRGEGSLYIAQHLNLKCLHLVDPYEYDDPNQPDLCIKDLAGAYDEAVRRLRKHEGKIKWWRMKSDEAFPQLPELDGVYIDGDHYEKPFMRDLNNAFQIVRPGGWVGGHDYTFGDLFVNNEPVIVGDTQVRIEVKPVVDKFIAEHGYYLFVDGDPNFPDWWFQKPGGE